MIFIPVCNTWKGNFFYEGIKVDLDSHERNPRFSAASLSQECFPHSGFRKVTDLLQGYAFTVIFTYDSETGRPTVFSVWLLIKRKFLQN
jgi:hypothetical protein